MADAPTETPASGGREPACCPDCGGSCPADQCWTASRTRGEGHEGHRGDEW